MSLVCAPPIQRGPLKGQTATGTYAGWQRHNRAGETPCEPCRRGYNQHQAANRTPTDRPDVTRKVTRYGYGPVQVWCQGCGTRGTANRRLLLGRTHTIDHCMYCREAS